MSTIKMKDLLPAWTVGTAVGHRNLTLVPLIGGGPRFQGYLLASEAIDAKLLTITEVSEAGTVSELLAVNEADRPILLIDGEELQGAKQNRILNTSVLLPPKSKTRIPVSCVEEGRWSHVSREFKSGSYSPSSLRQRKSQDVHYSLRTRGRAESDQGAVWDSVSRHIDSSAARAPSRAMSDAVVARGESLDRYQAALPYPAAACGVVAAVRGRFIALDAFDSPSTLEAIWGRLVASYAMDAEVAKDQAEKTFTAKAAEMVLEHVGDQKVVQFAIVGFGQDLRFETVDLHGQCLSAEDHLLHMSVFPRDGDLAARDRHAARIVPPSRRR
jgi:hypothetical protein